MLYLLVATIYQEIPCGPRYIMNYRRLVYVVAVGNRRNLGSKSGVPAASGSKIRKPTI